MIDIEEEDLLQWIDFPIEVDMTLVNLIEKVNPNVMLKDTLKETDAVVDYINYMDTLNTEVDKEVKKSENTKYSETRQDKIDRYLYKKKRRCWNRGQRYEIRQRFANSRPRYKGRFLPVVSKKFVPVSQLNDHK